MPAPTQGCLFTTIKNTSGGTKHFGFLPPHGVTLAANAEVQIFGDVASAIYRNGGHKGKRASDALASALRDGDLEIISSPCVVVYDTTDDASYRIGSDNGSVIATTTRYDDESYESVS